MDLETWFQIHTAQYMSGQLSAQACFLSRGRVCILRKVVVRRYHVFANRLIECGSLGVKRVVHVRENQRHSYQRFCHSAQTNAGHQDV